MSDDGGHGAGSPVGDDLYGQKARLSSRCGAASSINNSGKAAAMFANKVAIIASFSKLSCDDAIMRNE
ncbi:MAG: hypothetical protein IPK63_07055 [Candidatus Competibacteraceae bacterium]|nr:hypothetical protein [Candidatus Competibacteraceae bacterium]